jgi:hypothetical protein
MGACDAPELCPGDSPSCPSDVVVSAGQVCRASIDLACDPGEVCDGVAASCPADVIACSVDGGPFDGGSPRDAGTPDASGSTDGAAPDAAMPTAATGCGCRAMARSTRRPLGVLFAVVLVLCARRRRTWPGHACSPRA